MHTTEQTAPEVIAALERPGFYAHRPAEVSHLQTHISHVFVAGGLAYKLKKPVNLGFLDFSSLQARVHYCQEELRLNRRLAPAVYLGLAAVVRRPEGLALVDLDQAGPDELLEPLVKMAELPQDRLMNLLLDQDLVEAHHMRELAGLMADFHRQAGRGPQIDQFGQPGQIAVQVKDNFSETAGYREVSVAPARWEAIRRYSLGFLEDQQELLERRVSRHCIVDGHGDLHAGNIVLPTDGPPVVFDCIEFNQRFRFLDVACDLAFLAMDLDFHGRDDLSSLLVDEYLAQSGDEDLLEVLDFYKCYRAVVRAKIHGFMLDDASVPVDNKFQDIEKAKAYWGLAAHYAGGEPPFFLVLMMGLMGTGKSFMARRLSGATDWLQVNSDQVRKQLAGLAAKERRYEDWGQGIYSAQATEATYAALLDVAQGRLSLGGSVIVDASFSDDARRRQFAELAREYGACLLAVEVTASDQVVRQRLERRAAKKGTVSDGRWELYQRQVRGWQPYSTHIAPRVVSLDGGAAEEEKLSALLSYLKERGYDPHAEPEA